MRIFYATGGLAADLICTAPMSTRPAPTRRRRASATPAPPDACDTALADRLRRAGLQPTRQRMAMARVLLPAPVHLHAEQVLQAARLYDPGLSRATVYASLPLFAERGLLRALPLGLAHTVYDSCTTLHPHLLIEDSGEVHDLPPITLPPDALPTLAPGLEVTAIDLVVRVRRQPASPANAPANAPGCTLGFLP